MKTTFPDIINAILAGDTVILIDNIQTAIVVNSRAWEKRSLEPPVTEDLIRGPRVGLNEDINVNKMLIRRGLRDPVTVSILYYGETIAERSNLSIYRRYY